MKTNCYLQVERIRSTNPFVLGREKIVLLEYIEQDPHINV